jgi:hypothetical protein
MLNLSNYSEKAVKISGEGTKAHKEKLKEMGGKYNKYLQGGPGWIFSRRKLPELETFLTSVNSVTVNANYLDVSPVQPLPTLPGAEAIAKVIEETPRPHGNKPPSNKAKAAKLTTIGQQVTRALKFTPDLKSVQRSVNILNFAMYKNGRLNINDLTNFVSFPAIIEGAEDGILIPIEPLKKAKSAQIVEGGKVLIDGVKYPCYNLGEGEKFPEEPEANDLRSVGTFAVFSFLNPNFLGKDELRPVMMYYNYDAKRREFCATDANVLRVWNVDNEDNNLSESFTCKSFLSNINEAAEVFKANDGIILFEFDGWRVLSKEYDGKYMNYEAVIPQPESAAACITFNAGMFDFFRGELPKLLAASNKNVPLFKLEYGANESGHLQLTVSSEDIDNETEYKNTVEFGATFQGEPGQIGFNINFFNKCLKELNDGAKFYIMSASRPAIFIDESGTILIMPVMIN